jgi:Acetyltransferase (GNAT) domain
MTPAPSSSPEDSVNRAPVDSVLTPTIFHEDWWLTAATNGAYEVVETSLGDKVVGRLPYFRKKFYGMNWGALPALTHFLGPAVDEGPGSINTRFIRRLEITRELILKLPPASFTRIKCHRGVPDVIPFQEQKWRTNVQFTWEVEPAPEETLFMNLRNKPRNAIRRAEFFQLDDPNEFIRFYSANLAAKGIKSNIDLDAALRIITAALSRSRGQMMVAKAKVDGALHAATFYAWDSHSLYYLMSTRNENGHSGAMAALVWHAIRDAAARKLVFDFDGLATPGSIMFYAGFGGSVQPRYVATRMTIPVRIANAVRGLMDKEQFFY